jgi:hypothetical protein
VNVLLAALIVAYIAAWAIEMILSRTREPCAHRTRVWRHIANAIRAGLGVVFLVDGRPLLALGLLVGTVVLVLYTEREYRGGTEEPKSVTPPGG